MDTRKIPISSSGPKSSQADADTFEKSPQFRVVDKRPFAQFDAGTAVEGPIEEKPRYPTYVEQLMAKVAETERRFTEKAKQVDQETARTKARLEAEYERKLALARRDLLLPFLDVLDNLERALQVAAAGGQQGNLLQGLQMTTDLFRAKLREHAVETIEVLNQPFDPNLSQAVGVIRVTERAKDGVVIDEVRPGYRMGDALLRPAQVRVGQYERE